MRRPIVAALLLAASTAAAAGQFYLFPVQQLEGVSQEAMQARPLVDKRVVDRLFGGPDGPQTQRALVADFVGRLANAYPASIIHPKQVFDTNIGRGHKFVNDGNAQCKQAPSFNVADTYAVVAGVTRASVYEVPKGDNNEVLIPVTLSLQFIKPNLGKVVYTISETVYSPFRLGRDEYQSGAADQVIREALLKNISVQLGSLVDTARAAFNPRDVAAKLVDKDGDFIVADQGIEAGFAKGEQVEARNAAGQASIFDVLYADSGYSVLRKMAGPASVGDSLQFVFETAVDDSRKPRLMPVVAGGANDRQASAVADIFARELGFKASFQLSPVDVHFAKTKVMVMREANCVTWQNLPAMAGVSGTRKDDPNFFLRFTPVVSPVSVMSGAGG
ncbi:MAG TPA: hypothetical protein VFT37_03990, partial [Telluria sp.]|nr:hypothetical protein [Telluria sp.]